MTVDSFSIDGTIFELPTVKSIFDETSDIEIRSSLRNYTVSFLDANASIDDALRVSKPDTSSSLLIADEKVLQLHTSSAQRTIPVFAMQATEEKKSLDGASQVIAFLAEQGATKGTQILVAGGGIIQDTVGFACAVYKRGIPWSYFPTTLLAQADSCIGSKTGINFGRTKNLLGLFTPPQRVVVHSQFLSTLDEIATLSGLGEIFKLCIIAGNSYVEAFETNLDAAISGDIATLAKLARWALTIKKPVIEFDELELHSRKALNFGHSVGHALEVVTDHAVAHGLAVCFGVLVECAISSAAGYLSEQDFVQLIRISRDLLPTSVIQNFQGLQFDDLCEVITRDKKVTSDGLTLPIPASFGDFRFINIPLDVSAQAVLRKSFETVLNSL